MAPLERLFALEIEYHRRLTYFIDDPLFGIEKILRHLATPFLITGIKIGLAISSGSSEIDLQHRISARGIELRQPIEAPN